MKEKMDRNLYKSDKKLAEQGWRSMRRTLDREMPEPRRRRPVALIWILGLLLPTAGGLAWLLFNPEHPGVLPRVEHPPVAVAPQLPVQPPYTKIKPLPGHNTGKPASKLPAETAPIQTATPAPKSNPAKASILAAAHQDQPAAGQPVYAQRPTPPTGTPNEQAVFDAIPNPVTPDNPSETGHVAMPDVPSASASLASESSDKAANQSPPAQTGHNPTQAETVQPESSPEPSSVANIEHPAPAQPDMP